VIRRHKTTSGLIKYQPKGEPADWAAAAKGILAPRSRMPSSSCSELNDRVAMREPTAEKSDGKSSDKKGDKKDARTKADTKPADAAKPEEKTLDAELSPDDADNGDTPSIMRRKEARARRAASSSFATNAGSSSTAKKSREMIAS